MIPLGYSVVTHTFQDTVTVELCREHTVSLLTFTLREEGGDVATEMGVDNNIIHRHYSV